jgi:hypothetical protein
MVLFGSVRLQMIRKHAHATRMLDAGCWMLDAGCWMLDERRASSIGYPELRILFSNTSHPDSENLSP